MSKVLGIIAEYNPFHNGHLYHIKKSKEITGSDYTVAIISGNFVQRGSASIVDKWSKAQIVLQNGVDLVIELPLLYSISSGENFADGAIKILNSLGIIDYLSFGSETDDIQFLNFLANILYNEPAEYRKMLSDELNKGLSFPTARENAIIKYIKSSNSKDKTILGDFEKSANEITKISNIDKIKEVLSSPNNILGIEYLKALKKYKSNIKPVCVKRFGINHNGTSTNSKYESHIITQNTIADVTSYASASEIRNYINSNDLSAVKKFMPENSYSILEKDFKDEHIVSNLQSFEKIIFYNLRKMSIEEIANLPEVTEGLEYSIKKAANNCNSIQNFIKSVKSKRYTQTRLQRILVYALLGITKQDMELSKKIKAPYIRILGCNENGKKLLSKIVSKNTNLSVITSIKKFIDENKNTDLDTMLKKDIFATSVYTLAFKNDSFANLDFTHKIF